jgi:hypothetical protein
VLFVAHSRRVNPRLICRSWFIPRLSSVFRPPVSASPKLLIHTSATGGLISSQSQEVQKKCLKTVNFLQFLLKTHSFLTKNAKKCKFLLIFTPIFTPKTNKSYKITLFTTANRPIFQKT